MIRRLPSAYGVGAAPASARAVTRVLVGMGGVGMGARLLGLLATRGARAENLSALSAPSIWICRL